MASSKTKAHTTEKVFHSGFVTLVGRPNAGKSSLLNAIMGKKLAITSSKSQTTRYRFRAVYTQPTFQLVIVDTPGIHKPIDALGEELNTTALKTLDEVDAIAFAVDASAPIGRGDEWVAKHIAAAHANKIGVLTKADVATASQIASQKEALTRLLELDDIIVTSAKTREGVPAFVAAVARLLPEGPLWFPADMETDAPIETTVAEFIREKILRSTNDEVPHAVGVSTEELSFDRKGRLVRIYAVIYVEHESQKGILIGAGGKTIKRIGTQARKDLELLLGEKVFLDLRVKVKKNWRRDINTIKRFGYGEGL